MQTPASFLSMISFHPWQCFQTSVGSGMFLRIPTLLPWWPKFPPPPPPDHNADFLPDFLHFYFLFNICPIFTLHQSQRSAKIFNGSQSQHMIRATRSKNARQLNKLPSQKPSLFSKSRSGKIKSQGWQFLRLLWCRTSKWRKWSGCIQKFLNAIIPMPCHSFGAYFKTTKPFLPVTFILFIFLVQVRHLWKQLDFRCFRVRIPN